MKRLIFIIILLTSFTFVTNAQVKDTICSTQKHPWGVKFGMITGSINGVTLSKKNGNSGFLKYNLFVDMVLGTPKTYHALMYSGKSNSLRFLNGMPVGKKGWEIYLVYDRLFKSGKDWVFPEAIRKTPENWLSVGSQVGCAIGGCEIFKCFGFLEAGIDFQKGYTFSAGILISLQPFKFPRQKK
jgi:hypothetical protein